MKENEGNECFLVIGSNSFTGSHFISYLLSKGIRCVGISRSQELNQTFLEYKQNNKEEFLFEFYQYDLNKNLPEIIALIKKRKFSHIVNFAAQSMVGQSWNAPQDWYLTNLVSLSMLINEIKDFDFIKKYISVTTPEAYGSTDGWIKEKFDFMPSTPYAISRAAQDLHLKAYYENFNFPVVFTRAANVYGPGQSLYRIIPRTIIEALTGGKLVLDGGGNSIRSFIHAKDVASATLKISLKGKEGSAYHISGKESILIKDVVQLVAEFCDIEFDKLVEIGPDRPGKDSAYLLNSCKLREELEWTDNISLKAGLQETLDWIKQNLDFLKNYTREYVHKK